MTIQTYTFRFLLARPRQNQPYTVYSTLDGKTGKLDEAVNRELNVTRS